MQTIDYINKSLVHIKFMCLWRISILYVYVVYCYRYSLFSTRIFYSIEVDDAVILVKQPVFYVLMIFSLNKI